MPITASAKKAWRQSKTRRVKNLVKKEVYKKLVSRYRKFVTGKNIEEAKKILPATYKALDKAAKANIISKNKANRLKSRLTKLAK
ncbi:MAG: 30S ribosomal protein S20 [Patescibacteria group bacterium]|nr:30S ribosomal protein S20 [Patescibacteria group bacterium]MDE2015129.1 30S ribosomal protein S20 [Patescibacteria group bacterium]MDE2226557.1 30S ribosomal protein S20 [Patescibacteria group bacterium]